MDNIVTTRKPIDCFTFTARQPPAPEDEKTTAYFPSSPSYTDHSQDFDFDFDHEHLSDSSIITSPSTPLSPDFTSRTACKSKQSDKLEGKLEQVKEEDFGTFEDWLRWDETDPLVDLSAMNNDPLSLSSPNNSKTRTRTPLEESGVFIEDPVSNSPLFQPRNLNLNINTTSSSFNNLNLMGGTAPSETNFNSPPIMSSAAPWAQQQVVQPNFFTTILSPQEEARLRSIAMPNSVLPLSASSRTSSYASSSPPSQHIRKKPALSSSSSSRPQRRKRKSTTAPFTNSATKSEQEDEDLEVEEPTSAIAEHEVVAPPTKHQGKKTSHNMIEKRYRNNLNDKIAELRDSVPSLRVMNKCLAGNGDEDEVEFEEDLQGLTPAHKLNKATILSKATEYISHLEKRNAFLTRENAGLKARVDAFQILMVSRQQQQQQAQIQFQNQQPPQQYQQQGYEGQGGLGGRGMSGWLG